MKTHPLSFLLADDDPFISKAVATLLRHMGHHVDVAENGKQAIILFTEKPGFYDVVMTDHNMPCVCGLELVQHLRKNGFDGKIIIMSGSLDDKLFAAYKSKRVDKILQKPFTSEVLASTLQHLTDQWQDSSK